MKNKTAEYPKKETLIELGFKELPHKNIMNSLIKKIGRNREISISGLGSGCETVFLCEINATDPKTVDDLVCVHNYDYDGFLTIEKLNHLHFGLTGLWLFATTQTNEILKAIEDVRGKIEETGYVNSLVLLDELLTKFKTK